MVRGGYDDWGEGEEVWFENRIQLFTIKSFFFLLVLPQKASLPPGMSETDSYLK